MGRSWAVSLSALILFWLAASPAAAEEIRPTWMSFDQEKRVVRVLMVAAADGSNGTMNFNGYGNGDMTVTVPLGWKVEVEFQNKGLGALPHSLAVINEMNPLPIENGAPAFPRALTSKLAAGMMAGQNDSFDFVASKEGRFLLYCGVAGHGSMGMWDYLVVSKDAKVPNVLVKTKK
jgi:sulfocyanin